MSSNAITSAGSIVTRADLETSLAALGKEIHEPRHGIHGPNSPAWRAHREIIVFLGGLRAALMQLAHPFVAHGIDQHSTTRKDVLARFHRTFLHIFAMTFGDRDHAFRAARKVYTIHQRITGTINEDVGRFRCGDPYAANDVDALLWVWATLVHTVVAVDRLLPDAMNPQQRESYYRATWAFVRLFGVPPGRIPPNWNAFDTYVQNMLSSDTIAVGGPARAMARFLLTPKHPAYTAAMKWATIVSTGLLPEQLREAYGLRFGATEQALFRISSAAIGCIYPAIPSALRLLPAYQRAMHRLGGRAPSRVSLYLERKFDLL
ncbi:MAG: DUF2236 domain-containing protein [Proteobacteria bacterium]|nr:DUF2236 domain-containing protein [Pseudomonadota bacterium]